MFNKLKQFKDIKDQAKQMQNTLSQESVSVSSSGVDMTMDGTMKITKLNISVDLLEISKKEKLEKAIISAHEDVMKKIQRIMATKMKDMGGFPGLN